MFETPTGRDGFASLWGPPQCFRRPAFWIVLIGVYGPLGLERLDWRTWDGMVGGFEVLLALTWPLWICVTAGAAVALTLRRRCGWLLLALAWASVALAACKFPVLFRFS